MRDYKQVPTSAEVWNVIRHKHPELLVFSSFSAPDGDYFGDTSKGRMFTSLGFKQGDYPIMAAETTWDIDRSEPYKRTNECHEYWLCLPEKQDV